MLSNQELKQKACAAIERQKREIIDLAKEILVNPETGFSEAKTAQLVAQKMDQLNIRYRSQLAITGVKGRIAGWGGSWTPGSCYWRAGLADRQ